MIANLWRLSDESDKYMAEHGVVSVTFDEMMEFSSHVGFADIDIRDIVPVAGENYSDLTFSSKDIIAITLSNGEKISIDVGKDKRP